METDHQAVEVQVQVDQDLTVETLRQVTLDQQTAAQVQVMEAIAQAPKGEALALAPILEIKTLVLEEVRALAQVEGPVLKVVVLEMVGAHHPTFEIQAAKVHIPLLEDK